MIFRRRRPVPCSIAGDWPRRRAARVGRGAPIGHTGASRVAERRRTASPTSDRARVDDRGDAAQEVGRGAVVDRHEDDAAQQAAPERDDPFGPVLAPDDDVLPAGDARGVQPRGEGARAAGDVARSVYDQLR